MKTSYLLALFAAAALVFHHAAFAQTTETTGTVLAISSSTITLQSGTAVGTSNALPLQQ